MNCRTAFPYLQNLAQLFDAKHQCILAELKPAGCEDKSGMQECGDLVIARKQKCGGAQSSGLGVEEVLLRSTKEILCSSVEPETRVKGLAVWNEDGMLQSYKRVSCNWPEKAWPTINLLQRQGKGRKWMWK